MARPRFDDPIEPMMLANMRENGVRSLWIQRHQRRLEVVVNVEHLAGELTTSFFGAGVACTGA
jgi:hypothetical protein